MFQGEQSEQFHPVKGVRQGDPLSPTLFLIMFNSILNSLPADLGFNFNRTLINHIAYADDLVIIAESAEQLQGLLDILQEGLERVGLRINMNKSFTFSWRKNKRIKKMIFDDTVTFNCNNLVFLIKFKLMILSSI